MGRPARSILRLVAGQSHFLKGQSPRITAITALTALTASSIKTGNVSAIAIGKINHTGQPHRSNSHNLLLSTRRIYERPNPINVVTFPPP